ncbi:trehalose-phosphatase [Catalinimonas niigatensis]|uniref:trehalose-phosphatase n=1 Tax=Catalinimonas niigatensis TaxID=1397264 RepID=UPI00266551BE|nr:trehalose-phosphatase [Catalinimonas niigatensis]WPP51103.1 trehalose-phosphatase [Catalinimonas niigatensis]
MNLKEPNELPSALDHVNEMLRKKGDRSFLFFFDFDGTLAPIVAQPDQAALSDETHTLLKKLAEVYKVAVVSGRDRKDVEAKVNLHNLYYAGSHGFDITGPNDMHHQHPEADNILPELEKIANEFEKAFQEEKQVKVEKKKFAIAIHHRGADKGVIEQLEKRVKARLANDQLLKWDKGKSIIEIKPNVDWNKGKAVLWIMEQLGLNEDNCLPVYLGDDTTDEDAFRELSDKGVSVMVEDHDQKTHAQYAIKEQKQVAEFIKQILSYA